MFILWSSCLVSNIYHPSCANSFNPCCCFFYHLRPPPEVVTYSMFPVLGLSSIARQGTMYGCCGTGFSVYHIYALKNIASIDSDSDSALDEKDSDGAGSLCGVGCFYCGKEQLLTSDEKTTFFSLGWWPCYMKYMPDYSYLSPS